MTRKRDFQRNRVYDWENRVVAPRDPSFIHFPAAQGMVNAIWSEMGLLYPPQVEPLPKQAKRTIASADRLSIFLGERTESWCLLHELAHALTTTVDGVSNGHSGQFMGVYVKLLAQYLRIGLCDLIESLKAASIEINVMALPVFIVGLDAPPNGGPTASMIRGVRQHKLVCHENAAHLAQHAETR